MSKIDAHLGAPQFVEVSTEDLAVQSAEVTLDGLRGVVPFGATPDMLVRVPGAYSEKSPEVTNTLGNDRIGTIGGDSLNHVLTEITVGGSDDPLQVPAH